MKATNLDLIPAAAVGLLGYTSATVHEASFKLGSDRRLVSEIHAARWSDVSARPCRHAEKLPAVNLRSAAGGAVG